MNRTRTWNEKLRDRIAAVAAAEASGEVADSLDVRKALLARVSAGEITLEQAQDELKRIRRSASRQGKTTRGRVWRRS